MTQAELKLNILNWFVPASGLKRDHVIFADQRIDQPDTPFGTIKLTSGPLVIGHDEERQPDQGDTDSDVLISGQRRVLCSLNIYSNLDTEKPGGVDKPGALQMMSDVRDSLERPSVYQSLNDLGITINLKSTIQNLTALLETEFQERAQLDVTFGYPSNIGDQPGSIEEVSFGGGTVTGAVDPAGIVTATETVAKP